MIPANVITEVSGKENVGWAIVEKDYFITLLLEGIANNPFLRANLVFKGGTALRRIYFKRYRYSEDLDFSLRKPMTENEIKDSLELVFEYLKKEHNADFRIRNFYGRNWFCDVKIQFVGLKGKKNTIALDLMKDEIVVDDVKEKKVLNPYYEKSFSIPVYLMEEILAEKLRSFLQRTRVRDYYDSWYLLTQAKEQIDIKKVKEIFTQKVKYKKISFHDKSRLLNPQKVEEAKAYYHSQLSNQLEKLPPFDKVADDLKKAIADLGLI